VKRLAQATATRALVGVCTYLTFQAGAWLVDRAYLAFDYCMRKRHA